ncbi:serine hydrolase domain-containing protein [Qipengyuania sp.]|uniref:serine hydrolase domain-containing protein n=1 Tax=Qipengyuania sp. TaxID=2004515 RepID=UPI0035C85D71
MAAFSLAIASCGAASDTAPRENWEEAAPPTRGLDRERVDATLLRAAELPNLRSLIVMRNGEELVAQRFNGGPDLDRTVNIKSASKSVMSALVGIAIERGVLDGVEQPVLSELRPYAPQQPDPRLGRVTVGNLLSMQAGLARTSGDNYGRWVSSPNWVRYALSQPFVEEPGGAMLYSTGSTHLLSAMLTEASGRSTWALAQEWLAEPLGVQIPQWERDPQGIYLGGNQMAMSPRGMARFGELYRLGGTIDGTQIVPEAWIERSWTKATTSPWSGQGYGYGWFIAEASGHPVYFAWGYGGQMIYIVPSLALTVVMTSGTDVERGSGHIGALWTLLSEGIVPAAEIGA